VKRVARHIHLLAQATEIRTAMFESREHVVVPVVALVEGVIHAANAETPELVLAEEFSRTPEGWNGRPVLPDHPKGEDGIRSSANNPQILESQAFGRVFNTKVEGKRLMMEAWLDRTRAEKIPEAKEILERIEAGEMVEVSVGAFVIAEEKKGNHNGQSYSAVWHEIVPDHLALLPKGIKGACSNDMGCGTPRAATRYHVTKSSFHVLSNDCHDESGLFCDGGGSGGSGGGGSESGGSVGGKLSAIADHKIGANEVKSMSDSKLKSEFKKTLDNNELIAHNSKGSGNPHPKAEKAHTVNNENMRVVENELRGRGYKYDPVDEEWSRSKGSRNSSGGGEMKERLVAFLRGLGMFEGEDPSNEEVNTAVATVLGDKNYTESDLEALAGSGVYPKGGKFCTKDEDGKESCYASKDEAVKAKAKKARSAAAGDCGCGGGKERNLEKKDRVAALVGKMAKKPAFKDLFQTSDSAALELLSDERLSKLEAAVDAAEDEKAKVEDPKPLTEEEWLKTAPESLRTIISQNKEASANRRKEMVTCIMATKQDVYTEEELNKMDEKELGKTARLLTAKVPAPDYSGAGVPRPRTAEEATIEPPPDMVSAVRNLRGLDKKAS
jgi:hypothetical protein